MAAESGGIGRALLHALITLLFISGVQAFAQPTLQYIPINDQVILVGLAELNEIPKEIKWQPYFSIYTGDHLPAGAEQPAVLGTYQIDKDTLLFRPRFPFVKGQTYTARFNLSKLSMDFQKQIQPSTQTLQHTFTVPKPINTSTTHVVQIYPTSSALPANLLKFYIYFSAPIRRGQTYAHIRLLDVSGTEVSNAFLELTPELWSPDTRRFTLFFDPGRIKRGLLPHTDLGLALKRGHTYRLVVEASLKDAYDNPLITTHSKTFDVLPEDCISPNPKNWQIWPPSKNTHEELVVSLDEPLDHGLLNSFIEIKDPTSETLLGAVKTTQNETQWHFTPATPWSAGPHTVHINPKLEDEAGNQLNRLFDVDITEQPADIRGRTQPIVLPFLIP
jgi:hypothetical protein